MISLELFLYDKIRWGVVENKPLKPEREHEVYEYIKMIVRELCKLK